MWGKNDRLKGEGGGVRVSGKGTFIIQGGKISNNSDTGIFLGKYILFQYVHSNGKGKITMNGGVISENTDGGVCVEGTFEMNSGIISGNTAMKGGGVNVTDGVFILNDGSIVENTAYGDTFRKVGEGGVYVGGNGAFTMNGGDISRNIANKNAIGGGGVFVNWIFTMNNGIISGNKTPKSGGGVFVDNSYATFTKSNTAGIIYGSDTSDDKANIAEEYGHAVYTEKGSRDTTARATMALDSRKKGSEGGWE